MLTVDALREYGANVDEGIARCAGKEELYLKLVGRIPADKNFAALPEALDSGDLDAAFEAAHGLKGVLANLSLTPVLEPVTRITESLRHREDRDYSADLSEMAEAKKKLDELFA
ncbi:MAG: Hpt domain-containing protein [Lachnospiraceae bacterium]|nr:Hpt domain-containing protein [Lachnospiraceae bacterium]